MRWSVTAVMVGVMLSSCAVAERDEWRWEQVDARTVMWEIPVTFPCWLEDEDKEKVLLAIDQYWSLALEMIPEMRELDVTLYTIHIHDNLGAFWVPEAKTWCFGWTIGHHIQIAWSWEMLNGLPHGIATQNPFGALIHEYLHIILDQVYGWEDPGHMFFPFFKPQMDMIAEAAPTIHLSELSKIRCHLYRYIPSGFDGPKH